MTGAVAGNATAAAAAAAAAAATGGALVASADWALLVRALAAVGGAGAVASTVFQGRAAGLRVRARFVVGFVLAVDFAVLWALPIAIQGAMFKLVMLPYLRPPFDWLDSSTTLRRFAAKHVYENPRHADFFATQLLFLVNFALHLTLAVYWQLHYGALPWWLIAVYNFGWVGIGGRGMGAAYTMAHKEGHNTMIYKPAIRNVFGNVFENWIGLWYGGVPYNFTTTHISLHHRLDGGLGDSLYAWDLQRCSWTDFMVYLSRGLLHMSGVGPIRQFLLSKRKVDRRQLVRLLKGVVWYWVAFPAVLLWAIPSFSFYFWIVLQPLVCMSFFIALINNGFHAFVEAARVPSVESVTLLGSLDDYFGEDDHQTHHLAPHVYYRDLPEHQKQQREIWARDHGSVFYGPDALTFGVLILLKAWPVLAERYVDFSGTLTRSEIATMLETRARRLELEHSALLPPLQDHTATGKPSAPRRTFVVRDAPCRPADPALSRLFSAFTDWSHRAQLTVAREMASVLPPVRQGLAD